MCQMLAENKFFNNKAIIKRALNMYFEAPDTFAYMT